MGLTLSGLRLGLSQVGGGGGPYLGLSGTHDYYIDATLGNDSNDGSEGAPWASLNKITASLLSVGTTVKVLVRAGTYDKVTDYIDIQNTTGATANMTIACEPGTVWDGTAISAIENRSATNIGGNYTWAWTLYGNGLVAQNYDYSTAGASPQAIGSYGDAILYVHDMTINNCGDGVSLHQRSKAYLYDVQVSGCFKGAIVNVDSAYVYAERCKFTSGAGSSRGIIAIENTTTADFYDCIFLPGGTADPVDNVDVRGANFYRCQLGTSTSHVRLKSSAGQGTTHLYDCYVNAYIPNFDIGSMTRCYGLLGLRYTATGTVALTDCVFVGKSTSTQAEGLYFASYDAGVGGAVTMSSCVFDGSYNLDYNWTLTRKAYLVNTAVEDCQIYGGVSWTANFRDVATITGEITTDPQIGSADSYLMADYASAAGLAGFGSGDVVERPAAIPRALP